MKVFISWSGERSRTVAEALRVWLPRVIQSIKPWMSDSDIAAGSRWLSEVSQNLDGSSIGIICVTPENCGSPWLNFEAGALSKALNESHVCPVALGMSPGQVSGPLSQFQTVTLDQEGMLRVLQSLNRLAGPAALPDLELQEIYEVWWPKLLVKIDAIPVPAERPPERSTADQIEELLQISREQLRRENLRLEAASKRDTRAEQLIALMEKMSNTMDPQATASRFQSLAAEAIKSASANLPGLVVADGEQGEKFLHELFSKMPMLLDGVGPDRRMIANLQDQFKQTIVEAEALAAKMLKSDIPDSGERSATNDSA